MEIAPNSIIKIYSGIPLDNSYENTLYFSSEADQESYFHNPNTPKYVLTRQSYQRVVKGSMRISKTAEELYDCNYLAFQNEAFGNKWFYAFITSVEYVNNETSEITFEIDIMQTYMFDVVLKPSFVEREHSATDVIGDNIVPENLELGEYMTFEEQNSFDLKDYYIVAMVSQINPGDNPLYWKQAPMKRICNTIQCCAYYVYQNNSTGLTGLQALLEYYSTMGKPDEILGVFMIPTKLFDTIPSPDNPNINANAPYSYTINIEKRINDSFEGYTPKNKKLYTYPYNFLYCNNMTGNTAVYPYEFFPNEYYCGFTMYGIPTTNTEIIMFPENYKGSNGVNKDEGLILKGFPQVAYNVDTFKAWFAQNSGSITTGLLASAVAGIAIPELAMSVKGLELASGVTAGAGVGIGVMNTISKVADHSVQPIQTKGNESCGVLTAGQMFDYTFFNKRIRGSFARIIDEYFTMFGYATHRVKEPNRHVRERWTYTKTQGCNLIGHCPSDDIKRIKQIYDKGITFWVNPSEVGNYSLSNNPL